VFGHLPHVQLLMTAGLPLGLLMFHRMVDRPTLVRAFGLGVAMALDAYLCAYYAVFLMLMIGYGVCFMAAWRRLWNNPRYWAAVVVAAVVAIVLVLPLLRPYIALERETGFHRTLEDARLYAAEWRMYFASSAPAHGWLLRLLGHSGESLLFPGFTAVLFGLGGGLVGWFARGRWRETAVLYGTLGAAGVWASFGPDAGLYRLMYSTVPWFTWLRAPSRFGLVVVLCLTVLVSLTTAAVVARVTRAPLIGALVLFAAFAESFVPIRFPPVPPLNGAYRMLATQPEGPLIELPVYSRRVAFRRARYMVSSTAHWKPLVNAYSDFTPPQFTANLEAMSQFPSLDAFKTLQPMRVRYAIFHLENYGQYRKALEERLDEFAPYLRTLYIDEETLLQEIVDYPERPKKDRKSLH
jgi:hypothetical protein